MKLSIIVPKLNLSTGGGSHYSLFYVCQGLKELGTKISIYSLNQIDQYSLEALSVLGIDVAGVNIFGKSYRPIYDTNDDIILVYGPMSIAYKIKQNLPHRPVIAYFNQLGSFCTDVSKQKNNCWNSCSHIDRIRHCTSLFRKIKYVLFGFRKFTEFKWGFQSLDACIFDSPPLYECYQNIYKLSQDKCFVIPECINFEEINQCSSKEKKNDGIINILFVSSLAHYKGIDLLFSALRSLSLDWRVWIFGDGPDRPKVEAFKNKFPNRVCFQGHVENKVLLKELNKRKYIYVHPCRWFEAFGRSIVEAMANKIPVIVPDVGGPSWLIDHKVNGIQYRHRDPEDIAIWIKWLVNNPKDLNKISIAGWERAQDFSHKKIAALWHKTLTNIVKKSFHNE